MSQSPSGAPPPPPPKTLADNTQPPQPTSPPVPPYQSHPLHFPPDSSQTPNVPPRPPSHPALSYAEHSQSPPQVYDGTSEQHGQRTGAIELSGEQRYAAGRAQGSFDHEMSEHLPHAHPQPGQQHGQRHDRHAPTMPPDGWVPDTVKNKSKGDLERLLHNPDLLSALLHHPSMQPEILQNSNDQLRQQLQSTSKAARQVSQTAAQIESEQARIQSQLLRTRGLEQTFRTRQHAHEDAIEAFSPRALHRRLAQAIREGEEELKTVEESWLGLDGMSTEREVGEWVKNVRRSRETLELRKERGERWAEGRVGGWR